MKVAYLCLLKTENRKGYLFLLHYTFFHYTTFFHVSAIFSQVNVPLRESVYQWSSGQCRSMVLFGWARGSFRRRPLPPPTVGAQKLRANAHCGHAEASCPRLSTCLPENMHAHTLTACWHPKRNSCHLNDYNVLVNEFHFC